MKQQTVSCWASGKCCDAPRSLCSVNYWNNWNYGWHCVERGWRPVTHWLLAVKTPLWLNQCLIYLQQSKLCYWSAPCWTNYMMTLSLTAKSLFPVLFHYLNKRCRCVNDRQAWWIYRLGSHLSRILSSLSALDAENELLVQEALERLMQGKAFRFVF